MTSRSPDRSIVVVCGSLAFDNAARMKAILDGEHQREPIRLLLHGGADGADRMAAEWARANGIEERCFPAEDDGDEANARRDQRMADAGAGRCIVFPGGSGTADMARRAEASGLEVVLVAA